MAHSRYYNKVLTYYSMHKWSLAQVRNAVVRGWITAEEFTEITGESYE